MPENEYDKIATTDDESLNGTGENDPVEEEERVQPGRGEGTTMSDSAEGDEVDGFDSRAAFLENWIENQNTTSATSSEDDNGPLFGSSASRDQLDPTIVESESLFCVGYQSLNSELGVIICIMAFEVLLC